MYNKFKKRTLRKSFRDCIIFLKLGAFERECVQ